MRAPSEQLQSDIRILDVRTYKVPTHCRTPLKFGAVVVEELPIGYAQVTVENRAGRRGTGWGAMFLMDLWAWPVSDASHEAKNRAMCDLLDAYAALVAAVPDFVHPIELFMETETDLRRLSMEASARYTCGERMPFLGALICASPVDHAVHDAFGHANGIDSYTGYGPEYMSFDLSRYLGPDFAGHYPSQFLRQDFVPQVPVFHLVGGLDLLHRNEVTAEFPDDGAPNSLDDWILRDGVFCLKVKLNGRDLAWDLARTQEVARVYEDARRERPDLPERPHLTADTNEQCESPDYMVEYLQRLREQAPGVYEDILYVEQPTERDLSAHRWDMRPVASLKPVLIDESLTSVEDFAQAMELGWSGIALKSCKCLSSDLLFLALAERARVPYAVQDLTNPSLALLHSVGLAARTHTILGVEANARQFFPAASAVEEEVHPRLFRVHDGVVDTRTLRGPGLGMQVNLMGDYEHIVSTRTL
ncbi:MAG: enolase C-terminal domain-like protein [Caldilineaceae bacterium]